MAKKGSARFCGGWFPEVSVVPPFWWYWSAGYVIGVFRTAVAAIGAFDLFDRSGVRLHFYRGRAGVDEDLDFVPHRRSVR